MKKEKLLILLMVCVLTLGGIVGDFRTEPAMAVAKKASVKLNKKSVSLAKGKKVTLKIVKKNVKKIQSTKWSSKNKKIATVTKKGKVTAKKAGKTTTVQCKVKYIPKNAKTVKTKTLKCKIKVKKASPKATATPAGTGNNRVKPKILAGNQVRQNPYLSDKEAMMHNDIYSSDVTGKVMPLGIHTEIIKSTVKDSSMAPPAFFYDNHGNAVASYNQLLENGTVLGGGIAIRDMDSDELQVKGRFQAALHDETPYGIQISYSFVDKESYLVGPTTHGHVVMINTYDKNGEVLPVFEKKLDVDVVTPAVKALGDDIDKNILSVTYDYEGNLWFVTGGFHMDPAHSKNGFVGYMERSFIDKVLASGDSQNAEEYLHFMKLGDGENAENGISAHPVGCVIETNRSCYLFQAKSGVQKIWSYDYKSDPKAPKPETGITGAGLAWGGGSTPTLTDDMVLFTDNQDVVNLIALDINTGKELVKTPVLNLGKDVVVAVENSICVYDGGSGRISVLVCNWYGAGSANLFKPDADSSIQTYDNIYDTNWRTKGSSFLMPGIERVDIVKQGDGSYKAEKQWTRADLKDTSMIKLSTSTGCYYGYTQNEKTSEWGFITLDYETGETVMWQPVSAESQYNNMAVGIMQGNNGNSIYCPTDSKVLVRIQDRFAYLPEKPEQKLDIVKMEREVISKEAFAAASGSSQTPVGYLLSAEIDKAEQSQKLAFRVNNLSGTTDDYTVYGKTADGKFEKLAQVVFADDNGKELTGKKTLSPDEIYEVRIRVEDSGKTDLAPAAGIIKTSIVMAR